MGRGEIFPGYHSNPASFAIFFVRINPLGNCTRVRESEISGLQNPSSPILILQAFSISVALFPTVDFLVPKKSQIVSAVI
jgi:hypothetical protein